jgi:hypothetical protein
MITLAICGAAAITLTGVAVIIHSARKAVVGYEDSFGFHEGTAPAGEKVGAPGFSHVVCEAWTHESAEEFPTHPFAPESIGPVIN